MRLDEFSRGEDASHRFVCAFGLLLSIKRESHEWPTMNANDVEPVNERTNYAVYCRIDLAEIVDVHSWTPYRLLRQHRVRVASETTSCRLRAARHQVGPATGRCWLQSAAPHRALASSPS